MKDGTREDYELLGRIELDYISRLADRLLADLELEKDALRLPGEPLRALPPGRHAGGPGR
jgi:hypothetical protein